MRYCQLQLLRTPGPWHWKPTPSVIVPWCIHTGQQTHTHPVSIICSFTAGCCWSIARHNVMQGQQSWLSFQHWNAELPPAWSTTMSTYLYRSRLGCFHNQRKKRTHHSSCYQLTGVKTSYVLFAWRPESMRLAAALFPDRDGGGAGSTSSSHCSSPIWWSKSGSSDIHWSSAMAFRASFWRWNKGGLEGLLLAECCCCFTLAKRSTLGRLGTSTPWSEFTEDMVPLVNPSAEPRDLLL